MTWSQTILKKFPSCVRCGSKATDAAHVIPRSVAPELSEDIMNGLGLCRLCHGRCDHKDRSELERLYKKVYGGKKWEELIAKRDKIRDVS